ncbi:MAG: 2-dehydropantoate 2-reductase, partial [Candidatus Electrothrix sp. AR1]|nr:2-dehydropantoate 2-reductase [Candidatus Electrothrix sp. AR1]
MKITIIGAGAMGCLFGGLLSEQGMDVHLIDVRKEQVNTLNDRFHALMKNCQSTIVQGISFKV